MNIERVNIAGVGVDIVPPEEMENVILSLTEQEGYKQIVFLSIWDLLKARHKGEFQNLVKSASLVLPISKSIIRGAAFLKLNLPYRYNPFTLIITVMSTLESHLKSVFLFGSRARTLHIARKNVSDTFPSLKIFGTHSGYYPRAKEQDIIKAIRKSSPSLVLYSDGIKDKVLWAYKRQKQFSSSIFIYYHDALGIFSKRTRRISEETFDKGHEIFFEILKNPLKIFLIFRYIWYGIVLVWYRLTRKKKNALDSHSGEKP